jgi:hypothetical protein
MQGLSAASTSIGSECCNHLQVLNELIEHKKVTWYLRTWNLRIMRSHSDGISINICTHLSHNSYSTYWKGMIKLYLMFSYTWTPN